MELYKGNVYPVARSGDTTPYDADIASMDVHGGFNQMDSAGFIKINAVRLMGDYRMKHQKK